MDKIKNLRFISFIVLVIVIVIISLKFKLTLLAPPFAVSAYLITSEHRGEFSGPYSVAISYIFVIITTTIFHIFLGVGTISLILNIAIVGLFITYTQFRHPPALALTIFSFIAHNDFLFIISALSIAALLFISDLLLDRIEQKYSTKN